MATLYVQGVPDELYEALRGQAHQHRKSIAAEVLSLLEQNVPTARKLKSRRALLRRVQRLRSRKTRRGAFPSTDESNVRTARGEPVRDRCQRGGKVASPGSQRTADG